VRTQLTTSCGTKNPRFISAPHFTPDWTETHPVLPGVVARLHGGTDVHGTVVLLVAHGDGVGRGEKAELLHVTDRSDDEHCNHGSVFQQAPSSCPVSHQHPSGRTRPRLQRTGCDPARCFSSILFSAPQRLRDWDAANRQQRPFSREHLAPPHRVHVVSARRQPQTKTQRAGKILRDERAGAPAPSAARKAASARVSPLATHANNS
jgi:hypothetical protein